MWENVGFLFTEAFQVLYKEMEGWEDKQHRPENDMLYNAEVGDDDVFAEDVPEVPDGDFGGRIVLMDHWLLHNYLD